LNFLIQKFLYLTTFDCLLFSSASPPLTFVKKTLKHLSLFSLSIPPPFTDLGAQGKERKEEEMGQESDKKVGLQPGRILSKNIRI
jgi:hypothetical protein